MSIDYFGKFKLKLKAKHPHIRAKFLKGEFNKFMCTLHSETGTVRNSQILATGSSTFCSVCSEERLLQKHQSKIVETFPSFLCVSDSWGAHTTQHDYICAKHGTSFSATVNKLYSNVMCEACHREKHPLYVRPPKPRYPCKVCGKLIDHNIYCSTECTYSCPSRKQRILNSIYSRFGSYGATGNAEVREKMEQFNLIKYGMRYPTSLPEIQARTKATCIEKYGVAHQSHDAEVHRKSTKSRFSSKPYLLGSREVRVQGYENKALDYLANMVRSDDILVGTEIDAVPYYFNKDRMYFPDIFIKSENLIIEVKSLYTLGVITDNKQLFNQLRHKGKGVIKAGMRFKVMLISKKGKVSQLPNNWMELSWSNIKCKCLSIAKDK